MNKYRGAKLVRAGFIGAVLVALFVAVGLSPSQLVERVTTLRYQALFSEAGGLQVGNDVLISGVPVGSVSAMKLHRGDVLVSFTVHAGIHLGAASTAHIRTGSLLGQRIIVVESAGSGRLHPTEIIPVSRTSAPYTLTDAISDVAVDARDINTAQLNHSLDTLTDTLNEVAPQLGPAFDGLSRVSRAINSRDQSLGELLKGAAGITGVLGERSQQVNAMVLNANELVSTLVERRQAIARLLASVSAVSQELTGIVHDNEAKLAPSLKQLNDVTAVLVKNRENINKALPKLAQLVRQGGETSANGFYTSAFIANSNFPFVYQWLLDWLLGFRAFGAKGEPLDTAGPRALFPFPFNQMPGGSR